MILWSQFFIFLHVFIAIFAQIIAILATGIAVLFLVQQRRVKAKNIAALRRSRFSLEALDLFFARLLRFGFVLLTFSVCSGFLLLLSYSPKVPHIAFKILWSLLVWLWYFISIVIRRSHYKTRTISAQMGSLGFLILLSTCFGFIF